MNTLSSLLNWIGNLVGADPSTLTTTSKTLVGALNEVDGNISSVEGDITNINGTLAKKQNTYTGFGTPVDITSYNSSDNAYTAPSNGLLQVWSRYNTGNYISATVSNGDGTNAVVFQAIGNGTGNSVIAVPIYKGQKAYVNAQGGSSNYLYFVPYTEIS